MAPFASASAAKFSEDCLYRPALGEKEMDLFWKDNLRESVIQQFKSLGYKYVTLDLEGYRAGSMNEALRSDEMSG